MLTLCTSHLHRHTPTPYIGNKGMTIPLYDTTNRTLISHPTSQ